MSAGKQDKAEQANKNVAEERQEQAPTVSTATGFPIVGIGASEPRGQRLPIDFFFRSLARDQHERAIEGGPT